MAVTKKVNASGISNMVYQERFSHWDEYKSVQKKLNNESNGLSWMFDLDILHKTGETKLSLMEIKGKGGKKYSRAKYVEDIPEDLLGLLKSAGFETPDYQPDESVRIGKLTHRTKGIFRKKEIWSISIDEGKFEQAMGNIQKLSEHTVSAEKMNMPIKTFEQYNRLQEWAEKIDMTPYNVEGGHDAYEPFEVQSGHDAGDEKKGLVSRIRDIFKKNKVNETATPSSTGVDLKTLGRKVETDKGITASAVANADSKSKTYTDNSAVKAKSRTLTEEQQNTMNNAFARMRKSRG
jgi:hypothetical protein